MKIQVTRQGKVWAGWVYYRQIVDTVYTVYYTPYRQQQTTPDIHQVPTQQIHPSRHVTIAGWRKKYQAHILDLTSFHTDCVAVFDRLRLCFHLYLSLCLYLYLCLVFVTSIDATCYLWVKCGLGLIMKQRPCLAPVWPRWRITTTDIKGIFCAPPPPPPTTDQPGSFRIS